MTKQNVARRLSHNYYTKHCQKKNFGHNMCSCPKQAVVGNCVLASQRSVLWWMRLWVQNMT